MRGCRSIILTLLLVLAPAAVGEACVSTEGLVGNAGNDVDAAVSDASTSDVVDAPSLPDGDSAVDAASASYVDEVQLDGPIAYWRMKDLPGATVSDEKGAFPGTVVGSIGFGAPGPSVDSKALRFDSAGWITVDALARRGSAWSAFALELWMATASTTLEEMFLAFSTGQGGDSCRVFRDEPTDLVVYDDGPTRAPSTTVPQPDIWYHVLVTVDAGGLGHLYVNGKDELSFAATVRPPTTGGLFTIGAENKADAGIMHTLKGRLSEVAIYDKAMPAARVAAHYTAMTGKTP